jgi:hypothetical protein
MDRAVLVRRRFRLLLLDVLRNDDARRRASRDRNAKCAVDQMAQLHGGRDHLRVIARDVHEQRAEVDLLLEIPAEDRARLLAHDGDDRLMIGPRVVQSREEVHGARTGGGETDAGRAGEFRVPARHERAGFLVARLNERDRIARAIDGADNPVDPIAGIAVDARDAPDPEALDQCVGNGACHAILLAGSIPPAGPPCIACTCVGSGTRRRASAVSRHAPCVAPPRKKVTRKWCS